MNGLHLTAELYGCRCERRLLDDAGALRELCRAVCSLPGLTPLAEVFHQFGDSGSPAGATGAVVLAESHLAVHTWPESAAVTLDLYVCNFSQDNSRAARQACRQLIAAFAPSRCVQRELERGIPTDGTTSDPAGRSD
ncbi:adenosylmethionine decarboxylase [Accumulibacter sp.]|uniref:adenosylmethionine decarboxylase n=1 Tax=Accumulibacter sp. TaxID=2053492 RepID=UPI0025F4A87C|nr:adenosylmethionine decarboxylase [Accumulibacter sp.]MCM8613899.1 adenosylmethionine decarboxylase [Accumulibacter sp.]MCM8637714.1 adenosylmethionine decarboxylase [Accumulibacter sp.]MCM8641072.1 adenosylmethionine decarboxylase [Accumulibacter sp.]